MTVRLYRDIFPLMSRPIRIEYEDAYYHVINRGRAHQNIFHNPDYYEMFLSVLAEAHQRFGVEIHSYCLMTNHYKNKQDRHCKEKQKIQTEG